MAKRELTHDSPDTQELEPQDGSAQYYEYYYQDPDYDGDDRHLPNISSAAEGIDTSSDFVLCNYSWPEVQRLGMRASVVADGDVHISLSPEEEDTIVLSSTLLKASHPFWKASLRDRWLPQKTVTGTNIKRLELEFLSRRESILVGKTAITAPHRRHAMFLDTQNEYYRDCLRYSCGDFDEGALSQHVDWTAFIKATINAHKIGFAILCGHPLKAWTGHPFGLSDDWIMFPDTPTLVILRLLD